MTLIERVATNLERTARTKAGQAKNDAFVNDGLRRGIARARQVFWNVLENVASKRANEEVTSD